RALAAARTLVTSARSGDLLSFRWHLLGRVSLLEVFLLRAAVVVTGSPLDLRSAQPLFRFDDGPLAMHPLRLDGVQPRALARQLAYQDPHAAFTLGPAVVFLDPAPHPRADMPGGIVPDQQQRLLALPGQFAANPAQEVHGHLADRPTVHETQQHPARVAPQQPVAGQRLGIGIP